MYFRLIKRLMLTRTLVYTEARSITIRFTASCHLSFGDSGFKLEYNDHKILIHTNRIWFLPYPSLQRCWSCPGGRRCSSTSRWGRSKIRIQLYNDHGMNTKGHGVNIRTRLDTSSLRYTNVAPNTEDTVRAKKRVESRESFILLLVVGCCVGWWLKAWKMLQTLRWVEPFIMRTCEVEIVAVTTFGLIKLLSGLD